LRLQNYGLGPERYQLSVTGIPAQPSYRDALLMGKFLAGFAALAISLTALWLMVMLGLVTSETTI
jgi:ABC-2 type transport system permease protein